MTSFFWPAPPVDHPFHRMCPSEIFEMPSLGILLLLSGSLIFSHLPLYFRGPQPLYSVLISCHTTRSAISKLTTVHGLNPKLKLKPYVTNKEKAMATHSGILAWEIPWTEGPSGPWSMGSQRVRHDLVIKSGEGNGNPLQYSCLDNPRDEGAWWAAVYGVAQSRTRLKRLSSSSNSHEQRLYLTQQIPTGYLLYTWQCIYLYASLSIPTFSFPRRVHKSVLRLHCSPVKRFISTIFLDSICMR